ncbi:MAG: acyl carrier protein [Coriobacteriia bacterium]|nr:acyl carrier protein [Coriobacteriia bacterium]
MDRTAALKKVIEVVATELESDDVEITEATSYVEDLGADSLDLIELVMAFEEAFGVEIEEDTVESIKTIGDTVDFVVTQAAQDDAAE